jgi:hypothetical protein
VLDTSTDQVYWVPGLYSDIKTLRQRISYYIMARIDVEKTIEELTLGEKVDLTAGKDNSNAPPPPHCPLEAPLKRY